MARSPFRKSLAKPSQAPVNSRTGRPVIVTRTGRVWGDDAADWLRDNDPRFGQGHKRRGY